MSIYVEIYIRTQIEELWKYTQDPQLHQRWDMRFTSIEYLARADETEPQRFDYSTRIGFGLAVRGEGESVGSREEMPVRRTSALRFWSEDPKSLIRDGAGYWQYIPDDDGVRFITSYDYRTRFGWFGRILDKIVFRPLLGWATAWSFDRLRLWIEQGIDPGVSMQRSLIHALSRVTIAMVWIYQGLVPKVLTQQSDEITMLANAGIPQSSIQFALITIGYCELVLGLIILLLFRFRWPLQLTLLLMVLATVSVAISSPEYLSAAFNPVSLNILVTVLAFIGLLVMRDLPTSQNCLRDKPGDMR